MLESKSSALSRLATVLFFNIKSNPSPTLPSPSRRKIRDSLIVYATTSSTLGLFVFLESGQLRMTASDQLAWEELRELMLLWKENMNEKINQLEWSRRRESNPYYQLGRLELCRWTTPAVTARGFRQVCIRLEGEWLVTLSQYSARFSGGQPCASLYSVAGVIFYN